MRPGMREAKTGGETEIETGCDEVKRGETGCDGVRRGGVPTVSTSHSWRLAAHSESVA